MDPVDRLDHVRAPSRATPAVDIVSVAFVGAIPVAPAPLDPTPARANFIRGSEPTSWRIGAPTFARVEYPGLWEGVTLEFRTTEAGLKYQLKLDAGADSSKIRFAYQGVESLELLPDGSLAVRTPRGGWTDSAPTSWQDGRGPVDCSFDVRPGFVVGFSCSGIDPALPLVIDPLVYSTYLGGGEADTAARVVVDSQGRAIVAGSTESPEFPNTTGAYDTTFGGFIYDAYVTMFNDSGTGIVWSTFVGGNSGDLALALSLGPDGTVYIGGLTISADFPTTAGAADRATGGGFDGFVTRLTADGSGLVYSTLLGGPLGRELVRDVVALPGGDAFVCGETNGTDFPATPGAFDRTLNGTDDGFMARLNDSGDQFEFASLVGGGARDVIYGCAVDQAGEPVANGVTYSSDFPTTPSSFQPTFNGGSRDGFVTALSADGSSLAFSSYVGGSAEDVGTRIAVDSSDGIYLVGQTNSSSLATASAFDPTLDAYSEAYLIKLEPQAAGVAFGTYLGGHNLTDTVPLDVEVNATGEAVVVGFTTAPDFPVTPGAWDILFDALEIGFVAQFSASGDALPYATYLGGTFYDEAASAAFAPDGAVVVVGVADSDDFPVTAGAFQQKATSKFGTVEDGFVVKLRLDLGPFDFLLDASVANVTALVDGVAHALPFNVSCMRGMTFRVNVTDPAPGPTTRSVFDRWSDGGAREHAAACAAPGRLTARFVDEYRLNLATRPAGLIVVLNGVNVSTPNVTWWRGGSVLGLAVPSPQLAPGINYTFSFWSYGGPQNQSIAIFMPLEVEAAFIVFFETHIDTDPPGLYIDVNGAPVTAPLTFWWEEGTTHELGARDLPVTLAERFRFLAWSDGGPTLRNETARAPSNLTAHFVREFRFDLTSSPTSMEFELDGLQVAAPVSLWWENMTDHTLAPAPEAPGATSRLAFDAWEDGGPQSRDLRANGSLALRALGGLEYRVNFSTDPGGVSLLADGAPIATPGVRWWRDGSFHQLAVADPASGADRRLLFREWSDGGERNRTIVVARTLDFLARFRTEYLMRFEAEIAPLDPLELQADGKPVPLPGKLWWESGSTHQVTALSPQTFGDVRYVLAGWTDGAPATRTLAATGPANYAARFTTQYRISIITVPPGIRYAADGVSFDDSSERWWSTEVGHALEVNPSQTVGGKEYVFANWSDGGEATHIATVTGPGILVLIFAVRPPAPPPAGLNLALAGGLMAAVVAAAAVGFLLLRRKRRPPAATPAAAPSAPAQAPAPPAFEYRP